MSRPSGRRGRDRLLPPSPKREVEDELAFHLEQRIADYVARGLTPESARAAAIERFGDLHGVRDDCAELLQEERRMTRRRDWVGDLRQDLRFGIRSAIRAPIFSLLAIITLALGIGANAAVFGVVKSVLLDALPYADAERLVRVYGRFLDGSHERGPLSAGTVADIAERQRSFAAVAAFMRHMPDAVYGGDGEARIAKVSWVEPHLFRTLGVAAAQGRTFTDDEGTLDTARVVVVSHPGWQRLLGGAPDVIGRDVRINGISRTVIGVLPRDFTGPAGDADFYFGLSLEPTLSNPVSARGSHWLDLIGRMNPGMTHDAAQRELTALAADIAREHEENASITLSAVPLRDAMVGDTRTPLLILMASAGFVLLITCANLAGALLSRTISRRREFAVRVALGAGQGRLVRQLLTESTLLALAGGAIGLLLATAALRALRGLASTALPPYAELSLDPGAVVVTVLVALATGLVFGVVPALSVRRADPQRTLRDESRGSSESRGSRQLRGALVAGQIALCVSLLVGAGLLARSLWAMSTSPLGVVLEGVLTVQVQLPARSHGTAEARAEFRERFTERLRALPGVSSVAAASALPTAVGERSGITAIEGAPPPPADAIPFVLTATVSDEYFGTLGIPVRRGRTFDARDHSDAPARIVISESMARRFWPDGDAVGGRVRMGPDPDSPMIEVIGVVADVRNDPARVDAEPIAYGSTRQDRWSNLTYLIRTTGDPYALVRPVQSALVALDPALPFYQPSTLRALLADGLAGRRLPVVLMLAFGGLALLLASVGVYAMFASMAAAREREFGVRIALGASRGAIAGLVIRQGATWMAVGLAGGAIGIVFVSRMVRNLLYGVPAFDPIALGIAAGLLVLCGTLALLAPIRRATRADPVSVLR